MSDRRLQGSGFPASLIYLHQTQEQRCTSYSYVHSTGTLMTRIRGVKKILQFHRPAVRSLFARSNCFWEWRIRGHPWMYASWPSDYCCHHIHRNWSNESSGLWSAEGSLRRRSFCTKKVSPCCRLAGLIMHQGRPHSFLRPMFFWPYLPHYDRLGWGIDTSAL